MSKWKQLAVAIGFSKERFATEDDEACFLDVLNQVARQHDDRAKRHNEWLRLKDEIDCLHKQLARTQTREEQQAKALKALQASLSKATAELNADVIAVGGGTLTHLVDDFIKTGELGVVVAPIGKLG